MGFQTICLCRFCYVVEYSACLGFLFRVDNMPVFLVMQNVQMLRSAAHCCLHDRWQQYDGLPYRNCFSCCFRSGGFYNLSKLTFYMSLAPSTLQLAWMLLLKYDIHGNHLSLEFPHTLPENSLEFLFYWAQMPFINTYHLFYEKTARVQKCSQ